MPRPSNTQERRREIALALARVMGRHGYEAATVAAIAREAGVATGGVHYHFASKGEILLDLVARVTATAEARIDARVARAQDPRARLAAILDGLLELGPDADPEAVAVWALIGAEAIRNPDVRELYGGWIAQARDALRGAFVAACRAGGPARPRCDGGGSCAGCVRRGRLRRLGRRARGHPARGRRSRRAAAGLRPPRRPAAAMTSSRQFVLPGGLRCELLAPHMPGVPGYHVLAVEAPARDAALDELARLAASEARRLGRERYGDEGAFSVIVNGARASRRPWAHAHIIPVGTPAAKRRAFAMLFLKGPLRRLERGLHRRLD